LRNARERLRGFTSQSHWHAGLPDERAPAGRVKDWKRTVAMFSGNELMKQIDAASQKIPEQDRCASAGVGPSIDEPKMMLLDTDHLRVLKYNEYPDANPHRGAYE